MIGDNLLHEELVALKAGIAKNLHRKDYGICTNLPAYARRTSQEGLRTLFAQWPEFSGNHNYPVRAPSGEYPEDYYWDSKDTEGLWKGDYGAARIRLLDFLIERTAP